MYLGQAFVLIYPCVIKFSQSVSRSISLSLSLSPPPLSPPLPPSLPPPPPYIFQTRLKIMTPLSSHAAVPVAFFKFCIIITFNFISHHIFIPVMKHFDISWSRQCRKNATENSLRVLGQVFVQSLYEVKLGLGGFFLCLLFLFCFLFCCCCCW